MIGQFTSRRYDKEWLDSIHETERLIRGVPLDEVPLAHRSLIKQQFTILVGEFRSRLAAGRDTLDVQGDITDLAYLVTQLLAEQDSLRVAQATAYAQ